MMVDLGVIPHTEVVAPVLDIKMIQGLLDQSASGHIPSMLSLILHNQMVADRKLNMILQSLNETKQVKKESKKKA